MGVLPSDVKPVFGPAFTPGGRSGDGALESGLPDFSLRLA
jgi:hypothetical protein